MVDGSSRLCRDIGFRPPEHRRRRDVGQDIVQRRLSMHTPPGGAYSQPMFTLLHANNDRLFAWVAPAIIPGDPGGLYASADHGTTWTSAGFTGLIVDRIIEADSVLFALQNGHVYASRTDSLAWKDVSGELTTDSIVVISASPEHLVALTEASDRIWYRPMEEIKAELNAIDPTSTPGTSSELPASNTRN